jgi:hypothetical protein
MLFTAPSASQHLPLGQDFGIRLASRAAAVDVADVLAPMAKTKRNGESNYIIINGITMALNIILF